MKTKIRVSTMRLGLLAIAVGFMTLFTGCQQEDLQVPQDENLVVTTNETQTRAPGPFAGGHGTVSLENFPIEGEGFRHFTFHAREKNNGNVEGNGVLTYIGGVEFSSFDIDCLVVDGNVAWMSGVVTRDRLPELVGQLCAFRVVDNGEGAGAPPDELSILYYGTDPAVYTCVNTLLVPVYPIEGGNIQVRE